ncbi:MAG: SoxR reducing system RseC family protein [Methylophilaceae bacterium]
MIEEHAVILKLETLVSEPPTENQSVATLEIVRKTACGLCGQTQGCGNTIWGKLLSHKSTQFKAQNLINAKVGDSVIVGIDESALMKSVLLLYMVPLVTMLLGAILIAQLSASELLAMLGALVGLLLGFLWVKGHTSGRVYYQAHQPKILRLESAQFNEKIIQLE